MTTITFANAGTFQACYAAEAWLKARGFSVGSSQGAAPRAIWHGDCYISKWRGLSQKDMAEMHAKMDGDMREGPVRITLMAGATFAARAAFALTDDDLRAERAGLTTAEQAWINGESVEPLAYEWPTPTAAHAATKQDKE